MSKIALLIGVDQYDNVGSLSGCEADADAMEQVLSKNADGSPNFHCKKLVGRSSKITRADIRTQVGALFQNSDADISLFFFAGHGALTSSAGGFLVSQDASVGDEGIPFGEVISAANSSPARERIIILDCCHSGGVDQLFGSETNIALEQGVSILAACRDTQSAVERGGRGLFSSLVEDALAGGAADVTGAVTAAGIYAYVDEVLSGWEQRPLLKANVSRLAPLRLARPAVSLENLRRLVDFFPTPGHHIQLDPSFEPTESPRHPDNEWKFGVLQQFRAARLVVPLGEEHLYYAAMNSKACALTPLGQFYWRRVKSGKL